MYPHLCNSTANSIVDLSCNLTMTAITINFNHVVKLTNDQFYQLCRDNPNVKFKRNAKGELIVMPATGEKLENAMPS